MKRFLLTVILLMVHEAHATATLVCSLLRGREVFFDLRRNPMNDKAQHCILSCHVSLKCGMISAWELGVIKEMIDVIGPGNAQWDDLAADMDGIVLAKSKRARTTKECYRECQSIYP